MKVATVAMRRETEVRGIKLETTRSIIICKLYSCISKNSKKTKQ